MRKLRLLVLGLNGMAGHLITDFFVKEDGYEIFGLKEELFLPANYNFITEINNTGSAILTERSDINNIFTEQDIEASGCTSDDCVTKIGALLNVEFIIKGSIVKLGENYVIDVKMFEVSQSMSPLAVTNLNEGNLVITKTFNKSTGL